MLLSPKLLHHTENHFVVILPNSLLHCWSRSKLIQSMSHSCHYYSLLWPAMQPYILLRNLMLQKAFFFNAMNLKKLNERLKKLLPTTYESHIVFSVLVFQINQVFQWTAFKCFSTLKKNLPLLPTISIVALEKIISSHPYKFWFFSKESSREFYTNPKSCSLITVGKLI